MTRREPAEVFRGPLEECLQHLAKTIPKDMRGVSSGLKQPIADFCGVGVPTVTRWLNSQFEKPKGTELFKLMCYLDIIGYRVIELEKMSTERRHFVELIGFGILSIQEANQLMGYSSVSSLYQVLYGNVGLSAAKRKIMWEAWKPHRAELENRKDNFRLQPKTQPAELQPNGRQKAAAKMMEALLALLDKDAADALSESELARLQKANSATILRLIERLLSLGSTKEDADAR